MKARFLIAPVAATLLGMLAATSPHNANATPINGSINLSSFGVILGSLNGTDLSNSTTFELSLDQQTTGTQTGDFTLVTPLGSVLTTSKLDLTNITAFTFGSAAFGTFDATTLVILHQSATNLDLFLTGTFSPGTDFGGLTAPGGASDHISLNETGVGLNASIAWAASFASPPAQIPTTVPEPAPLLLLGVGLCIAAMLRRLKGV